jgi:hypothetical protein
MRIGYLDCFSGVSGDMWVGALLDAGLPIEHLIAAVHAMELPGLTVRSLPVIRASLRGIRFVVEVDGREPGRAMAESTSAAGLQPMGMAPRILAVAAAAHGEHRRLADVLLIVRRIGLPVVVEQQCERVFRAIAEVEAVAHGTTVDDVHFHEVGAVDTIVDVVCACLGTHLLGMERLYCSAVAVGSGTVRAAHGVLPVPAPATLDLLLGIPVRQGGLLGERTTPTGAALLRTLVHEFEPRFTWLPTARGYGAGTREDPLVPNLLRLTIGELRDAGSAIDLIMLQCHLDTATGELLGYLLDEAMVRGAIDVFATAIQMKKGRPGQLLTLLCDAAHEDPLTTFLLEESTTLGVRRSEVARTVIERWTETRTTPFGNVQFKLARLPSGIVTARPEDDEVRRVCREHSLSRAEVLRRLQAQ